MKKLLTILLALLVVTGVVFADDLTVPGDATLSLTSSVSGFIHHGFFEEVAAAHKTGTGTNATDYTATGNTKVVNMSSTTNNLGFYSLWTNSLTNVTVSFIANSLTTSIGAGENPTVWNVPYTLTATLSGGANEGGRLAGEGTGALTNSWFGIETPVVGATNASPMGDSKVVFSTTGSGSGYISIALNAAFNTDNATALPEGTYTGTIVASVVAN